MGGRRAKKIKWEMPRDEQGRPIVDAYLRMSDGWNGKEDNRENQLEDIMPLYDEHGWALGMVLQDGVSAWQRGVVRDDYETLLVRIETGLSAGVTFYDQDRLLRRPMDLERLLELWEAGRDDMVISSMYGPVNLKDGNARLNMRNAAANAMKQSDDTSRRARRKNAGRRKRGLLIDSGPRPFAWMRKDADAELVKREQEALQWAFEYILEGGKGGLTEVARRWNAKGLLGYYGNPWNNVTVRQAMMKQRHAGRIEHEGEVVGRIEGCEKPTIDPEIFDQVMTIFTGRRRGRPISGKSLGAGVLVCSRCGHHLVARPRYKGDGSKVAAYKCAPPKGCGSTGIDQAPVDKMLRSITINQLSSPGVAQRVSQVAVETNEEIRKLSAALMAARQTSMNLTVRNAEGELPDEEYVVAHRKVSARILRLEEGLAQAQAVAGDVDLLEAESKREVAERWDAAAAKGDTEGLRAMLKSALRLDEVEIRPGRIPDGDGGLQWVPPYRRIALVPAGGSVTTTLRAGVGTKSA